MGLRFRKSISLMPGLKLNFGKTGMSVSAGVPGFRKTFHTSGKVTTTVGLPGTGIYYVDTQNPRNQRSVHNVTPQSNAYASCVTPEPPVPEIIDAEYNSSPPEPENRTFTQSSTVQLDLNSLKSIHKTSDDSIDWTEVLVSAIPPDETYCRQMWQYYHSVAPKILSGDIDAYLQLIYEVNPLDDLLSYGKNFEFGTDNPTKIEVEFTVNTTILEWAKREMSRPEYHQFLQDFICSMCIRIARDMFALLPVVHTVIHAVLEEKHILSVDFERSGLSRIKFGYIDPSDTLSRFRHNMDYTDETGFLPVDILI